MTHLAGENNLVWHYTTPAGLKGIVSSHKVRATSAAFMNDSQEMKSGNVALATYYESIAETLTDNVKHRVRASGLLGQHAVFDTFLLSASVNGDSLTLWRNYGGNEVAYAVAFDRNVSLSPLAQVDGETHPTPPRGYHDPVWEGLDDDNRYNLNSDPDRQMVFGGRWEDVKYISGPEDPKVARQFEDLVKSFGDDPESIAIPTWAFTNSPVEFMKHIGFDDEREVRAVYWLSPHWKFVLHRPARFGLVPFIELTATSDGRELDLFEDAVTEAHRLPIRAVTIGPTAMADEAANSLRLFLDNNGYGDVIIRTSETPFR